MNPPYPPITHVWVNVPRWNGFENETHCSRCGMTFIWRIDAHADANAAFMKKVFKKQWQERLHFDCDLEVVKRVIAS